MKWFVLVVALSNLVLLVSRFDSEMNILNIIKVNNYPPDFRLHVIAFQTI